MGDDDEGGLRRPQEGLQRLTGRDVQVVGRLIEEQQVRGTHAQQRQLQSRALTPGELRDGLLHVVTAEQEARQVGPRSAGRHGRCGKERVEHRGPAHGAIAQLREVAGHDVPSDSYEALEGRQLTGDGSQQRRLAGAVRPDQPDAIAASSFQATDSGDGHRGATGDRGQVAAEHLVEADHDLGRARRRGTQEARPREAETAAPRGRRWLGRAKLLEAALVLVHLDVLALAPIALHELLFTRDGRARLADQAARPRIGSLPLQEVRGVAATEGGQAAVAQLPDPLHDVVQERPVVGGHEERATAPHERRLQPLEGRDVEVVGGLVEHEQVGVRHQEPGQGHARLLAAGELPGGLSQRSRRIPRPASASWTRWSRW